MSNFIMLSVLLVLNIWLGINHVKNDNTTKIAAFTWFIIGWLAFHVFVHKIPTLL